MKYTTKIVTTILLGLGIFQLLLILGLPLGRAAWGGSHAVLPLGFRIGSTISIIIYLIAIYAIRTDSKLARIGTWFFGIYFLFGVLLNLLSSSPWERYIMAPLAGLLGVLFILAARHKGH